MTILKSLFGRVYKPWNYCTSVVFTLVVLHVYANFAN